MLRVSARDCPSRSFVNRVVELMRYRFPRVFLHLRSLGVDIAAWTARGLQDGFCRLLPFDFALRIVGAVLFEGSSALTRYSLALLQILQVRSLRSAVQTVQTRNPQTAVTTER